MGQISSIKAQIKVKLDELVTDNVIACVIEDDFKKAWFDRTIAGYPCAVLTTTEITSEFLTFRDNLRIYKFPIVFIMKAEAITGISDVEDVIEAVLNKFDNDPNLGGSSNGGVMPVASTPEAITARDSTYVVFSVIIEARQSVGLTFPTDT